MDALHYAYEKSDNNNFKQQTQTTTHKNKILERNNIRGMDKLSYKLSTNKLTTINGARARAARKSGQ